MFGALPWTSLDVCLFVCGAAEKKKQQLAEKYEALRKSGKLDNFLSQKRRRNAVKDRRKLPRQPHGEKAA